MYNGLLNNNLMTSGCFRAYAIKREDIRVYVPGLMNETIFKAGVFDEEYYNKVKNILPTALFESTALSNTMDNNPTPCWVVFENGDINHPIIMGFFGYGVKNISSDAEIADGKLITSDKNINDITSIKAGDIESYVNAIDGNTLVIDKGPGTGSQCVELINDYVERVFGIINNGGFGNGIDYYSGLSNQHPDKFYAFNWTSGTELHVGDIVSTTGSTQWGHVILIKSIDADDTNKVVALDQWNAKNNYYIRETTWTVSGTSIKCSIEQSSREIKGVARPL